MTHTQTAPIAATVETFEDLLEATLAAPRVEAPAADLLESVPVAKVPAVQVTWTDRQKNAVLALRMQLKAAGSPLASKPVKPTKEEASAFITEANAALNVNVPSQRTDKMTPWQRASMRGKPVTAKQWGMLRHMRDTAKKMGLSINSRLPVGCDRLAVSDMIARLQAACSAAAGVSPGTSGRCCVCGDPRCNIGPFVG